MSNVAKDLTVVITTIPTRRVRLKKALESVEAQTLRPFEIIVQTDTEGMGAPYNRDTGLLKVRTKYVAFLDDDDYFYRDHLETLYGAIKEQDADIVYSWFDVEGGTDPFPQNFGKPWDNENPVQTTVTTLCKTQVVRDAGGFSNTYGLNEEELSSLAQGNTVGEDFRMVMSALQNGAKIYHVPKRTWAYVHWRGNTSGRPTVWAAPDDPNLLVIVPSRGRPENAQRLLEAVQRTTYGAKVDVVFAVDSSDPSKRDYPANHTRIVKGGSMVKALNEVALKSFSDYDYLAFLGDDTLPNGGWYGNIMQALLFQKNSIVYGNDGIQGENLPTSVFMDSNVVRSLGYMALPTLNHLFVDNFWKALGQEAGTLLYAPDAYIEHLHPLVGKGDHDEGYERADSNWDSDSLAWKKYQIVDLKLDAEKLK